VRAYQPTAAYTKALRKRKVWVEPLFAEAKAWRAQEIDLLDGLVDHIHDRGAALIIDGEADMPQDPQETLAYRLGNRSVLELGD
jgi:hypothetical protein